MKKYALIVAAGSGTRMGSAVPKQFLSLQGRPLIWHTLEVFLSAFDDLEIILVLPAAHIETGKTIIQSVTAPHRVRIVQGGETRFHSVKNGLGQIEQESVVFVHDGVRCLVTAGLIRRCYELVLEKGNAVPAIASMDSLRLETNGTNEPIDRKKVRIIQTPQTFYSSVLKKAFEQDYLESFTDEATVVEKSGIPIHLVEGEATNIKITSPIDLMIAESILKGNRAH